MEMQSKKSSRLFLFVLSLFLLATSIVLTLPRNAEAACCGWRETETYYFDAAQTQFAGRCTWDDCAGTVTCTGTVTGYIKVTRTCCEICQA
jgi:hypothetical protein